MAIKIKKIVKSKTGLGVEFTMDRKKDGHMIQEIMKALVHLHYGHDVFFGYDYGDKGIEKILEFDYGCNPILNQIIYDGDGQFLHQKIRKNKNATD